MPNRLTRILALTAGFLAISPARGHAQAESWWRHVTVLAHDSMRGRQTGSVEHRKAAAYIAEQFKAAGLEPIGTNGFLQPVEFVMRSLDETQSSLAIVNGANVTRLTLGEDASLLPRAPLAPRADAPVVFVGYGLSLPEYGVDDLAGLDLRGKIVVHLPQLPKGVPGPVVSHSRSQAWQVFRERGAIGLITFGTGTADSVFVKAQRNRFTPAMMLADRTLDAVAGNQVSVTFNTARGEKLFVNAPERFAAVWARADSGLPLPHFELGIRMQTTARVTESPVSSENVAGILRGSDPQLRDQYVVITAHMDHTGVGAPVNGDSIYNGAMDNASGTALLIETAKALAPQRASLKRSLIFLAVTAEEKGLLGSRYYANHPTVPAEKLVANLNTDMFMPFVPLKLVMANGLEESNLADDARRAGASVGVAVVPDPEPEENRFIRSDQYSFILRGIPSLSLKVGVVRDSPEHAIMKKFRAERYHLPSDDLEQPLDRQAAEDFGKFYVALVREVANRPTKPAWFNDSFFKRLAK